MSLLVARAKNPLHSPACSHLFLRLNRVGELLFGADVRQGSLERGHEPIVHLNLRERSCGFGVGTCKWAMADTQEGGGVWGIRIAGAQASGLLGCVLVSARGAVREGG